MNVCLLKMFIEHIKCGIDWFDCFIEKKKTPKAHSKRKKNKMRTQSNQLHRNDFIILTFCFGCVWIREKDNHKNQRRALRIGDNPYLILCLLGLWRQSTFALIFSLIRDSLILFHPYKIDIHCRCTIFDDAKTLGKFCVRGNHRITVTYRIWWNWMRKIFFMLLFNIQMPSQLNIQHSTFNHPHWCMIWHSWQWLFPIRI